MAEQHAAALTRLRLIEEVQQELASLLRDEKGSDSVPELEERALAGQLLPRILEDINRTRGQLGQPLLTEQGMADIHRATLRATFDLGELEPLLANDHVENIDIIGHETVVLAFADGRKGMSAPIASSDEALVRLIKRIASRHARHEREFSDSSPMVNLELPGGERLAAMMSVSDRPTMSIRRHRYVRITLEDLYKWGTISQAQLAFLRAAMRAQRNIMVCGDQRAGKTTLLRALCHEIPQNESFATLETEYELGLHRQRDRFPLVKAFEAKPGNSERLENGVPVGGISLDLLVWQALRMNTARIVVGEVRGREVVPMLDALSTGGAGGLSTVHARSAEAAVERMVSLCLGANPAWSTQFAYRQVGEALDVIVHVKLKDTPTGQERFVDEIVSIERGGEQSGVSRTAVFLPSKDPHLKGRGVPSGHAPGDVEAYEEAGFNRAWLKPGTDGQWQF